MIFFLDVNVDNVQDVQYDNFDHNHVLDEDDNVGNHDQNQDDNSDQSDGGDNSDHNDGDEVSDTYLFK
jgi:hypothetical protein